MTETHEGHPTGIDPEDTTRWLQQLRAELSSSVNGSLLRGARPVQVGTTSATGGSTTLRPIMSAGALVGYSLTSAAVGTNVVRMTDRDGNLIAIVDLSRSAADDAKHATAWFGPGGINIPDGGLFLTSDEAFEGVVYLRGSD